MKFIVLGAAGRMGQMHARHLKELGHEVYGVDERQLPLDIEPCRWASLTNEMRSAEFDGVVIATPADRHHLDLWAAVRSNLHIFIEKPICLIPDLPNARCAAQTAMEKRLVVAVGYNLRFHPVVKQVKEFIAQGTFKPQFAAFMMRQAPTRPLAHFLEEWASHEVDLAMHLLGHWRDAHLIRNEKLAAFQEFQLIINHMSYANCEPTSLILADAYTSPFVRSFILIDRAGRPVTHDIESDHVRPEHYRNELEVWVRRIELREYIASGAMPEPLATGIDGLAVIDLLSRMTVENGVRKSAIGRTPTGI